MKELQAWFELRARREQRIPYLDDVLLSGNFAGYAGYRLRLFFVRYVASALVHVVRVLLLSAAFSRAAFLQLLLAEAAVGFASSFWWGALESMRDRVRRLHRQGRPHVVPREIERWLMLAWALAAGVTAACAAWLAFRSGPFGAVELYGVALFVRLALQFVTRTFHSGAYAIRRIYRPPWAIVAVELTSFAAVALAWPIAGAWALPIATLVASVIGASLTIWFTRRLYLFLGLAPRWMAVDALRRRWPIAWTELTGAGLSFAVMKLDAVLVFGLFNPTDAAVVEIELFVLLFVMSPTIQAGFDWAQLFYFDLKRLEDAPLAPLREQYGRYLTRLAWAMGVVCWLLGSLTGTIVYLRSLGALYWLLLPFFLTRSLLASAQIQAFCARRYGALLATATLWLIGFAIATRASGDVGKLIIVTLATAAIYVVLPRVARPAAPRQERWVGVVDWVRLLSGVSAPVCVRSARIVPLRSNGRDRRTPVGDVRWAQRHFARTIAARLGAGGAVTIAPPDSIVWFEPARCARIRPEDVAALSGGVAQSVRDTGVHADGRTALAAAWRLHGLDAAFGQTPTGDGQRVSLGDLERQFAQLHPAGWVFRPGTPAAIPAAVPPRWRRRIIREASRFLTDLGSPRDRFPLDVTALSVGGRLRLVFVAERGGRSGPRRRWRAAIRRANVRAAMGAVAD